MKIENVIIIINTIKIRDLCQHLQIQPNYQTGGEYGSTSNFWSMVQIAISFGNYHILLFTLAFWGDFTPISQASSMDEIH